MFHFSRHGPHFLNLPLVPIVLMVLAASGRAQTGRRPFQPLRIPEAISGKVFTLNLHKTSKSFWKGATTATYAFNDESFWGPTLIFNQGDRVQLNVKNSLDEPTTAHWHGLHVPATMDGGPHQVIAPGTTWSPSFVVKNHAGTYWYHPHAHETTQKQLTYGAGGLIIIHDPAEIALALPRTYGVDDIPLALTSRRFYTNDQFSFEGDNDKYGDYLLANGTLDAEVVLPAQFVRLRILNAEIERGYNLGFRDNRTFYVIATDGGLVDKPIPVKRMRLMVGERVEVLVNLGGDKLGTALDLMAFNANQPFGFPGGERGTSRPNGGYLNNTDFRLLHIKVGSPTANPTTALPDRLVKNRLWTDADVTNRRTVQIAGGFPGVPFSFDDKPYAMHVTNQVVKLDAVEKWTVVNNNIFGHCFHLHDVPFHVVGRSDGPVMAYEEGWKDSVYVPRGESVSFIAKFDDFASDSDAYMYHCHMANHEDAGLMGEFVVVRDPNSASGFRHSQEHTITASMSAAAARLNGAQAPEFSGTDLTGHSIDLAALAATKPVILFFIDLACPCSRDAAPFLGRLQDEYGAGCQVVGVIDAAPAAARQWAARVGCQFSVIPDPDLKIIRAYAAVNSVYTTLIDEGGVIDKTYTGYGRAMLTDIGQRLASSGLTVLRPTTFNDAPERLTTGCAFPKSKHP